MTKGRRDILVSSVYWPSAVWNIIGVVAGLLGGTWFAFLGAQSLDGAGKIIAATLGGVFGAALGAGGALVLYLLLGERVRSKEMKAFANVRPLTGRQPLDLGGWSADPFLSDRVIRAVTAQQPRIVLECGSGWTTVLVACCLRELSTGKVISLEHSKRFADRTRALLQRYGVADRAKVIYAPIKEVQIEGEIWPWYGIDPGEVFDGQVDIVVVDGPPGDLARRSRYPAVPLLADQLSKTWTVFLDDGRRSDEAWIAEQWARRLGVDVTYYPAGAGVFVLQSMEEVGV